MSFDDKKNEYSRRHFWFIVITADFCANTFGTAPCTASGEHCFNTYATCADKPNYSRITKEYLFVSQHAPLSVIHSLNAKNYIADITFLPTEILEEKSVCGRATINFFDEPDTDMGIDPYLLDRQPDILAVPGTFWKKFLARNPYMKGKKIEIYEGFEGLERADFKKRFTGTIEKMTEANPRIEAVDALKKFEEAETPSEINSKLNEDLGNIFEAKSEVDMLALPAITNDLCRRLDFAGELNVSTTEYADGGNYRINDRVTYTIVGYDTSGKAFLRKELEYYFAYVNPMDPFTDHRVKIAWTNKSTERTLSFYRVWVNNSTAERNITQLAAGITASDLYLTIPSEAQYMFADPALVGSYYAQIYMSEYETPEDDPNMEWVLITAGSGTTKTITRAQKGTLASAHNTAGKTYKIIAGSLYNNTRYFQTTGTEFTDNGLYFFEGAEARPETADRLFRMWGKNPTWIINWSAVISAQSIALTSVSGLNAEGYIAIEDEIIYYNGIAGLVLQNIQRLQFKTKAARHYTGTTIKVVDYEFPANPFTLLLKRLRRNAADTEIEVTRLESYRDAWAGPNFSTQPIIKKVKESTVLFDMVNMLNGMLWVNEDGKIDFKFNTEIAVDYTITDADNIVQGSASIDHNEEEIYTRIILSYNRIDVTKQDDDNYTHTQIEIDAAAEGVNEYNNSFPLEMQTTWLNEDCGFTEIGAYLNIMLPAKLKQLRARRSILTFNAEMKDSHIRAGMVISLASDEFLNVDGTDCTGLLFRVIKKDYKDNLITFTCRLISTGNITTSSERLTRYQLLDLSPYTSSNLTMFRVSSLNFYDEDAQEYKQAPIGLTPVNTYNISTKIKLAWDNMFMSQLSQVVLLTNTGQEYISVTDARDYKTVSYYKIFMCVLNDGETEPEHYYPNDSDSKSQWFEIGSIPDKQVNDATFMYYAEKIFEFSLVGKTILLDVWAVCDLRYTSRPVAGVRSNPALGAMWQPAEPLLIDSPTGLFFITRASSDIFSAGMVNGQGFSLAAEKDPYTDTIKYILEADTLRVRNSAAANRVLPGIQSIGGFAFCSPAGQLKTIIK